jgi:hypothetical protein
VRPEARRKPSRIAKLIFLLIAVVTLVVVWAFVRTIESGPEKSADHVIPVAPGPFAKPEAP